MINRIEPRMGPCGMPPAPDQKVNEAFERAGCELQYQTLCTEQRKVTFLSR